MISKDKRNGKYHAIKTKKQTVNDNEIKFRE